MGRVILPSIDGIVSAIEIVTNPEKYTVYMAEFQYAHDRAKEKLGDVDTKDKLEALGVLVDSKQAALDKSTKDAQERLRAEHASLSAQRDAHEHELDIFLRQQANAKQKHEEALREISKRYADQDAYVKQCDAEFAVRRAEYDSKDQALAEREAKLDATTKRIAPVAAALGVSLE